MRRGLRYFLIIATLLGFGLVRPIQASSTQAYTDYLYQFDLYRQSYSDFQIAKNEYDKFRSLTSQTTALEKTKAMLSQRDRLLRAYLLLLNEKLNENSGMAPTQRGQYQGVIANEVKFLENHSLLVPAVASLGDATKVSQELESHYVILQASIRQTIIALSVGYLSGLAVQYDKAVHDIGAIAITNTSSFPPEKRATVDRWLLQIGNKRSLYQQKIDDINSLSTKIKASSTDELGRQFGDAQKQALEAKQYLSEGVSFIGELITSLRYQN